jgi:hypothetical protein
LLYDLGQSQNLSFLISIMRRTPKLGRAVGKMTREGTPRVEHSVWLRKG